MSCVVGIGGIFFKAKDAPTLREWYRQHLGMNIEEWGGMPFHWNRTDGPGTDGTTIWSIFEDSSDYFAPSTSRFMINFIVRGAVRFLPSSEEQATCDDSLGV